MLCYRKTRKIVSNRTNVLADRITEHIRAIRNNFTGFPVYILVQL